MQFDIRFPLFSPEGDGAGAAGGGSAGGTLFGSQGSSPQGEGGAGTSSGGGGDAGTPAWTWAGEDGTFNAGWQDKLPDGLKGNASLQAIRSVSDLAKSYVETKSMVGKRLEMPGEGAKPEDVAAWRKIVGAPEKPEGYRGEAKNLKPEALPDDMWSEDAEKKFLDIAHKHHLTPAAVKEIMGFYGGSLLDTMKAGVADEEAILKAEGDKLRQAWGADFDGNLSNAKRMAVTLGLDPLKDPMFSHASIVEAFNNMSKLLSEDKLVGGEKGNLGGSLTDRIKDITDPKSQSMLAREYRNEFGTERQAAAQQQLHRLMNQAKPAK